MALTLSPGAAEDGGDIARLCDNNRPRAAASSAVEEKG
jgi:hypothetical protein